MDEFESLKENAMYRSWVTRGHQIGVLSALSVALGYLWINQLMAYKELSTQFDDVCKAHSITITRAQLSESVVDDLRNKIDKTPVDTSSNKSKLENFVITRWIDDKPDKEDAYESLCNTCLVNDQPLPKKIATRKHDYVVKTSEEMIKQTGALISHFSYRGARIHSKNYDN